MTPNYSASPIWKRHSRCAHRSPIPSLFSDRQLLRKDPSSPSADLFPLETYVLSTNHFQIELLANLDQVPQAGALVVVAFPKPLEGSGFPARVFAILP